MSEDRNEELWYEFNRNTPEAFWDVAVWYRDPTRGWVQGSLDVAERKRIFIASLEWMQNTPAKDTNPDRDDRDD